MKLDFKRDIILYDHFNTKTPDYLFKELCQQVEKLIKKLFNRNEKT